MNREIKFRAWDTKRKIMNSGQGPHMGDYFTIRSDGFLTSSDSEHIVLMQFTGLKDKNGKEIYEGDIVEYDKNFIGKPFGDDKYRFVIVFQHAGFLIQENEKESGGFNGLYAHNLGLSVIGNIYQNPDLLK